MSSHYAFLLSLPLHPEQAAANADALRFVIGDAEQAPASLPSHRFFKSFHPKYRLHQAYRGFDAGAWQSGFWQEFGESGECTRAGVNLNLPGNQLEGVAEDLFLLADWLASMSNADGAVGIVVAEDMPDSEPMVLYVRGARLYIGDAKFPDTGLFGRS